MERIDGANATSGSLFQDADPGTGQLATSLTAKWCNNVQEEICGVVLASGATLNGLETNQLLQAIFNLVYPVGAYVHWERDDISPGQIYNWQTWTELNGVVLVGRDTGQIEFQTTGEQGGEKTHTLSVPEMPSHIHAYSLLGSGTSGLSGGNNQVPMTTGVYNSEDTTTSGGGDAHNNLQPYRVVRMWRRTA